LQLTYDELHSSVGSIFNLRPCDEAPAAATDLVVEEAIHLALVGREVGPGLESIARHVIVTYFIPRIIVL